MWGKKSSSGDDSGENRIRIIEALTTFAWEVIDMYHQGIGPGAHEPMSPSLAKAMIGDEINRQLGEPLLAQEWRHARLRIAGPEHIKILAVLSKYEVVTARWIGARDDEDELVLYATIKCDNIGVLEKVLKELAAEKLEVRDGTFGLFVR